MKAHRAVETRFELGGFSARCRLAHPVEHALRGLALAGKVAVVIHLDFRHVACRVCRVALVRHRVRVPAERVCREGLVQRGFSYLKREEYL